MRQQERKGKEKEVKEGKRKGKEAMQKEAARPHPSQLLFVL